MIVTHPGLCLFLFSNQLASLAPASSLDIRRSNAPADNGQAENQVRAGPINPFLVIFGSANWPWNTENWTEVSDTVRGGQSKAVLKYLNRSDRTAGVSLEGMLDTKTLGGAGFASQVYRHPISLPMAGRYLAFFLEVEPVEQSHQELLPLVTVQRDSTSTKLDHLVRISIPFNALVPTFRGRPKSDEKPFDPHQITQISFMARSFFNHQTGPFLLNIRRLGVD
ncbi:hypothetical protein PGTUg99_001758 [Puccinia graminis f. sp. tritici]|uniref:NADH:ubiquinone oxidoreductase intermediate-associated protein 30 domain-containing protein n=1 Tax=Puccinia graminis f. sp. tritici TaxID=56615 RepID=A0A5B0N779_PUCGR|nr:hypothetical protein PGTUg99_001758 [Puccinia graminis f. sp. tritici]